MPARACPDFENFERQKGGAAAVVIARRTEARPSDVNWPTCGQQPHAFGTEVGLEYFAGIHGSAFDLFRMPAVVAVPAATAVAPAADSDRSIIRNTCSVQGEEASGARGALTRAAIIALIGCAIAFNLLGLWRRRSDTLVL